MLFAIHPPTLEFQLTVFRLMQRNGERWIELCAHASGERVAGLLREGVVSWQVDEVEQLPREVLDSASRQADDLIGDNRRLGELAWRNQVETWTGFHQAVLTWQRATFGAR